MSLPKRDHQGAGARSDSMIFPDDHPASPMDACIPVLGGLDRSQPVEFTDALEPLVDELPGAGPVSPHFAAIFPRAAARAVQHMLRAPDDGTDTAVLMQNAFSAGDTFLRPGGPLFEDADERRVESRIDRLVVPLGDRLDPGAASQRKDDVVSFDRFRCLLDEDVVALPFDRQLAGSAFVNLSYLHRTASVFEGIAFVFIRYDHLKSYF
jgi:hypothetical protein